VTEADGAAPDDRSDAERLREKLLDLLIFMPTGLAVSVAEELPKLAARGRERLGVQVSSARAVGEFAVRMGGQELRRISARVPPPGGRHRPPPTPRTVASPGPVPETERAAPTVPTAAAGHPTHYGPTTAAPRTTSAAAGPPSTGRTGADRPVANRMGNGNVPAVATLAIPAFDTLSASQVVQRLDGLSREELVSVRAYETSTRGRRTILNRVDQLLEERA
jgi:hypothetical protein